MKDIFTGEIDLGQKGGGAIHVSSNDHLAAFPGQVLDVCLNENSVLYEGQSDIGMIRYRPLGAGYDRAALYEDEVGTVAYPLDRSLLRYPLPGEQVLIYVAAGDEVVVGNRPESRPIGIAYYSLVVAANRSTTINTNPSFGTPRHKISSAEEYTDVQAAARFDKKIEDLDAFKADDNTNKLFKQLRPFEGDFILQGRYGNTFRMGSTSPTQQSPWSKGGGASGDPISIIRVDRAVTQDEQDMLTTEDVNTDDASLYLSSSQTIPVNLSCTLSMKAWKHTHGIQPAGQKALDSTKALQKGINNPG